MEIKYSLGLEDYLNYQEYIIKNKLDEGTNKTIDRWTFIMGFIMLLVFPLVTRLILGENFYLVVSLLMGLGLFSYYFINREELWWKDNKKAYRKLLLRDIFKDEDDRIPYSLYFDRENFILDRAGEKREYRIDDISSIKEDRNYIYFRFKDGRGTIVSLAELEPDSYQALVDIKG